MMCMKETDNVLIIAEAGINHNGEIKLAKKMIDAVKKAGADCIKFQTYHVDDLFTDKDLTYTYKSQGKEVTESQYEMFKRCMFTKDEWGEIMKYCKKQGVVFATTAQNPSDLDLILSIGDIAFIKVGSDDLTNILLLRNYAKMSKKINRPMIISAGMAYGAEIGDAVETIRNVNPDIDLTVLHCVSSYPTDAEEVNLKKILIIRDSFGVNVGFSDHTIGSAAAVGSICFGARVIEKHFTLDNNLPGPDHWFSINAEELGSYISDIRFVEKAIGNAYLAPTEKEQEMRKICRRNTVAKQDIEKGEIFKENDFEFKRTSVVGISPRFIDTLVGRAASKNYKRGDLIE